MRTTLALALGPLVFALAAPAGAEVPAEAPRVPEISHTVTRISRRVIVLDCLDVHVTAIAADSGIVVIDTNRSPAAMRHLRGVIEAEFGRRDFIYLIHTHAHQDHSRGSAVFPSVPLIAHQDYAASLLHAKAPELREEWVRRSRLEEARARLGESDPLSPEADAIRTRIAELETAISDLRGGGTAKMPAITFRDSLELDLGDLTLELRFCGEAHTNHDIVVYVPEEKLLLAGDLICSPQSPCFAINAMAEVPRLVRELEGLLEREEGLETIVPGHGKILTRSDLEEFCRTLTERYGRVRTERSAARILGQTIEREGIQAALERCPLPDPDRPDALDWSEGELGTLGGRLVRRGRAAEAVQVLELAVRALPGSAFLFGCLGDVRLEGEDREAAADAYRKSLALAPDYRYAAEMLEVLRSSQ